MDIFFHISTVNALFIFFTTQGSTGMDGMFGQPGQRGKPVSIFFLIMVIKITTLQ